MILFFDAIVVLVVLGVLPLFKDAVSAPYGPWAYWMLVATCIVVGHFLVVGAYTLLSRSKGNPMRRAFRRPMIRKGQVDSVRDIETDQLSDEDLDAWIEKHPRDSIAIELLCDRLEKRGETERYLREVEYLVTLESDMSIDYKCSLYHKMADLYEARLGRPDRCRMALIALCEEFPRSYQAVMARKRLERMDEGRGATSP